MAHQLPITDPNLERNDTMVPEYWESGESLQDAIRSQGYQSETVEGIAVDLHDLCQAVDRIRDELVANCLTGQTKAEFFQALVRLKDELVHVEWHANSAVEFLQTAAAALES